MIHQYKLNGYNIVLDTCSGSVHAVDEVSYDIIELFPEMSAEDIASHIVAKYKEVNVTREDVFECIEDIKSLADAGKLYSKDIYADHIFDFTNKKDTIKALCLHVAHTCNLNCEYCLQAKGNITETVRL